MRFLEGIPCYFIGDSSPSIGRVVLLVLFKGYNQSLSIRHLDLAIDVNAHMHAVCVPLPGAHG